MKTWIGHGILTDFPLPDSIQANIHICRPSVYQQREKRVAAQAQADSAGTSNPIPSHRTHPFDGRK